MADSDSARIYWRCRRGLLELDLVLGAFVDEHFHQLAHDDQVAFARLLELPDPVLLDILVNGVEPPPALHAASVVDQIRSSSAIHV